jgi:hypothetical protein
MTVPESSNAETLHKLLFLLHALDPFRGPRAQSLTSSIDTRVDQTSIRRSFIEAIAIACASQKGPHHVIAAAPQQTSTGITLWLAGNEGINKEVELFINPFLDKLRETVRLVDRRVGVDKTESLSTNKLLPDLIKFQRPRLQVYYYKVKKRYLPPCLKIIESAINRGKLLLVCPFEVS